MIMQDFNPLPIGRLHFMYLLSAVKFVTRNFEKFFWRPYFYPRGVFAGFVVKKVGAWTSFCPITSILPYIMITARSVFMFSKCRLALTNEALVQSDDKDFDEMQPTKLGTSIRIFSCSYIYVQIVWQRM